MAKGLAHNSLVISAWSLLSLITGLAVDVLMAAHFGLSAEVDAFFVALTIPQLFNTAIISSARVSLVPLFIEIGKGEQNEQWYFLNNLLVVVCGLTLVLVASSMLVAGPIVRLIAPGLSSDASSTATSLFPILMLTVTLVGLAELAKTALNVHSDFATSASTGVLNNLAIILLVLLLQQKMGVFSFAVGYVAGGVIQVIASLWRLKRYGYSPQFVLNLRDAYLRRAWRLAVAPLTLDGTSRLFSVVERFLASMLPAGSIAALSYAGKLATAFMRLSSYNVATAGLPALSECALKHDVEEMQRQLVSGLRLVVLMTLPIVAFGLSMSQPFVLWLYGRGAFSASDAARTGLILALYVPAVAFQGVVTILLNAFYARQNTVTPIVHLVLMNGLNVALDLIFFVLWGVNGIALALSVSLAVSSVRAWVLVRKQGIVLPLPELAPPVLRILIASSIMALAGYTTYIWLSGLIGFDGFIERTCVLGSSFVTGCLAFAIVGMALGIDELRALRHAIAR